jgi:hypothetical protein
VSSAQSAPSASSVSAEEPVGRSLADGSTAQLKDLPPRPATTSRAGVPCARGCPPRARRSRAIARDVARQVASSLAGDRAEGDETLRLDRPASSSCGPRVVSASRPCRKPASLQGTALPAH